MSEQAVAVSERAGPSGAAAGSARRWWILGVVGLAQLMVVLDATIVNIALPRPSTTWASPTRTGNGW